jgi:hypothetical protein
MWQGGSSSGGEWPGSRPGCRAAAARTALAPVCLMAVCLMAVCLVMPRWPAGTVPGRVNRWIWLIRCIWYSLGA